MTTGEKETKIFEDIVSLVEDADLFFKHTVAKKQFVLGKLREQIDKDTYVRYAPFIEASIDGVVSITKNRKKKKKKKNKMLFSSCFFSKAKKRS